jgi:cation:H+ antiporter
MVDWLFIAAGLALLYVGAEGLIRGSVRLSIRAGISSLVVGLTVVAFGTSTPELFVSLQASGSGSGNIAVGNVIGSNIFNIALILGLSAIIRPIAIQSQLIRQDIPVMIGATTLFVVMARSWSLGRIEGAILFGALIIYILMTIRMSKRGDETVLTAEIERHLPSNSGNMWLDLLWMAGGITLLATGSHFLVKGAVNLATAAGVSQAVIGLTLVAAGTGLPELATSLIAAMKKESDLAIGNIVGSNIFNVLCIGGLTPLLQPIQFTDIEHMDLVVMTVLSILLLPMSWSGLRIGRREGLLLLGSYGAYLYYIWPMAH